MNDRFNFRCFDPDIQKFIVGFRLCDHYKWPNGIIEQSSGLKDKKGNLIYEGDIVKTIDSIGEVKWDKGGFWVVCDTWVIPWNFFTPSRWEIVGNIHENKELLKGEKR